MVANRLVGPSEVVLSPDLVSEGVLLLDSSTKMALRPGQRGCQVNAWPTCSEAVISVVKVPSGYVDYVAPFERQFGSSSRVVGAPESCDELRVRQGKTTIRRFNRHNSLTELVTFTYAEVPPFSLVNGHVKRFIEKFQAATSRPFGAYVWVPEWGKETHRLHVHMSVGWWSELNANEVCDACATEELRAKRHDIPAAGGLCIGELWGRGFVGRPESNSDGRGLSRYLSKYLTKDLGGEACDVRTGSEFLEEGVPFGGHRYFKSKGDSPSAVSLWAPDWCVAEQVAIEVAGGGRAVEFARVVEAQDSNFGRMEYLDFVGGGEKENVQNL